MKLREAFVSKMAAAAFVMSAAHAPAPAQDIPENSVAAKPVPAMLHESKTTRSLSLNPVMPVGVIAGLGGAYALILLVAGGRRRRIDGVHAALGGLMVVALLNPEFVQEERAMLPTEVALVIDRTSSQTLADRSGATEEAKTEILKKLAVLDGVNVRIVELDGKGADGTNLLGAVRGAIADIAPDRLGAVIALTDGQVHDADTAENLTTGGAPLHALISGRESEYDRRIVIEGASSFGLVNEGQDIKFRVFDDGNAAGSPVRVTISSEGRVVATQDAIPGEIAQVRVVIPHAGTNLFELKVEKQDGELTPVNNRVVASIEGIRQSLSVLLVSGNPNPNLRMMRDLLKAEAGTNLVHFTIRRTPEKIDTTPSRELALVPLPTHELFTTRLGKFDVVIFDHYEYNGLIPTPYFNNVARYVKDGGAVMVVSGPEYAGPGSLYNTPLKSILPVAPIASAVTEEPYVPRISKAGERHPVTRSLGEETDPLAWGRWLRIIESEKAVSGQVVMEGDAKKPLLILKRVEKGRMAMLQSDSANNWARGFDGGGPYASLIMNTLQWLMKNQAMEEETIRLRSEGGKLVAEQQTMGEKSTPLVIETPSGRALNVLPEEAGPGLWRATVPAGEQGIYSAAYQGQKVPQTYINVGPENPKEYASARSTTNILKPVVEKTGGLIVRMADTSGRVSVPGVTARTGKESMAGADWMGIRRTEASVLKGIDHTPLLPWWAAVTLGIGLAGGFYWLESGRGKKKDSATRFVPGNDGPGMP